MNKILTVIFIIFCCFRLPVVAADKYSELLVNAETERVKENYKEAILYSTKAIETEPEESFAYFYRANMKFRLCETGNSKCDYISIIKDYSDAIQRDNMKNPEYTASLYSGRARVRNENKEYENAVADNTKAISLTRKKYDKYNGLVYYQRAEARMALNDIDGAISDYTKSIKYNRYKNILKYSAYLGRCNAYKGNKEYKKAIEDANMIIKLVPDSPSGYLLRGASKALLPEMNNSFKVQDIPNNIKIFESALKDLNKAKELYLQQNDTENYNRADECSRSVNEILKSSKKILNSL